MVVRQFLGMLVLSCVLGMVASGCGDGSKEVKVTGSVVQGGNPLEGVNVGFDPNDAQGSAKGAMTDASGKFATTLKPGSYTVLLTRMVDKKGNLPKAASDDPALVDRSRVEASLHQGLPAKFTNKATSPFKVDIPRAGKELPPFDVSK